MYTEGCWGAPFPQHPARAQSNTRLTHSFQSSASTGSSHTFPFSPSSVFPKARATRALLIQSIQGQQGVDLRVQRFTLEGIFVLGQLWNQIWVLWKKKILPLASEEQRCYSFLSQAAFRNSTEQMQNSTSTGQRAMPAEFSLAHVIWVPSNQDSLVEEKWQVWLPNRETAQRSVPASCLEDLNPRIRNVLLHKPTLQLFGVHRTVL